MTLFKIRTVTSFVAALPDSDEGWQNEIRRAAHFLRRAQQLYECKGASVPTGMLGARASHDAPVASLAAGYEVQTLRICTRALSAATDNAAALASRLEEHCLEQGITFLSLGSTSDVRLLDGACLAALTRSFSSCSFRCGTQRFVELMLFARQGRLFLLCSWQQGMGLREARQLAAAIHGLAEQTAGAGNFRFGVAFNCEPGIPYFPVAAAGPNTVGFAIGTENSGLLHAAFQQAAASVQSTGGSVLDAAQASLQAVMEAALGPVQALAEELAAATGQPYLGIDASIAPALEPPTIPQAYELLGLGRFGCCGTLAISGALCPRR